MSELAQGMEVDGTPEQVRARLDAGLLRVGSVWFPTVAELHAWSRTTTPLYVRWLSPRRFELGPRTAVLRSATLCPVLRGELRAEGRRTRLSWRLTFTPFTVAVLGGWAIVEAVWAAVGFPPVLRGEVHPTWCLWWALPGVGLATAAVLGWVNGRRLLADALGSLRTLAGEPPVDEDW